MELVIKAVDRSVLINRYKKKGTLGCEESNGHCLVCLGPAYCMYIKIKIFILAFFFRYDNPISRNAERYMVHGKCAIAISQLESALH